MPLLWLSLCFIAGILIADWSGAHWGAWLALGLLALGLWPLLQRAPWGNLAWLSHTDRRIKLPPVLLLAALAAGGLRYQLSRPAFGPTELAHYNGTDSAVVSGWVSAPPDRRDTVALLRLRAESIQLDAEAAPLAVRGDLQVMLPPGADWRYGDRLALTGSLTAPPEAEDFSYRAYLARQGVYATMAYPRARRLGTGAGSPLLAAIYALRERAQASLKTLFPPPEGPLLEGILLGLDKGLPPETEEAFRRTGTAHIIAISGFNMAILAGLFASLFGRLLSRWWAALAALLALAGYTVMVGAGASVVRAAVMSGLSLVAVQIGRRSAGLNALFLAAGVMSLFHPDLPWDVSFQLSFAATFGLVVYAARLEGWALRAAERHLPGRAAQTAAGLLAENVLFTLVAQAFTLPVIVYHFGRISLVAPLANLLILPAQPYLMIFAGLAVLAGLIWLPLGGLLAAPAWGLAAYTLRVVGWLGQNPGAEWVTGPGGLGWVLLVYAVLLALAFGGQWLKAQLPRLSPAAVILVLAGLAGLAWRQALASGDGRLHVLAFNLGGESAFLLRAPGGESVLINGGPRASQLSAALGRWLPPLDRHLDALLIDNPAANALKGLPDSLARFPPTAVYLGADLPGNASGRNLQQALAERGLEPQRLQPGDALDLGDGAQARALACQESGCALWVEWKNFAALLPGGYAPGELAQAETAWASAVLLTPADLKAAPLADWQALGTPYLFEPGRLASGGWAHLQTDGERLWVEEGR